MEAPRAADDKDESGYWLRRARLAAIEGPAAGRTGLLPARAAHADLSLRPTSDGKLQDDLGDEAHTLWTEARRHRGGMGSMERSPASPTDAAKADDARWEKPTKALPTFELADLSGKTWSVKSLNGKVVLHQSLGHLVRSLQCGTAAVTKALRAGQRSLRSSRSLPSTLTKILGLVEPFMKEKGYTFPVVPAYSYVVNLLDGYAIPQNWVLNPKGALGMDASGLRLRRRMGERYASQARRGKIRQLIADK